jgi:hypothetical protein
MDAQAFDARFALLLETSVLAHRGALARAVHYAVENSMSALRNTRQSGSLTAADYLRVVFDWFVTLSRAFRAVPTGILRISGDGLWVSKDVVLSVAMFKELCPGEAEFIQAFSTKPEKTICGPASARALREMNFEGELFRQVIVGDAFETSGPFSTNSALILYALRHARSINTPLLGFELLCASALPSWSMRVRRNDAPWASHWRKVETHRREFDLCRGTVTFSGQRKAAADFFGESIAEHNFDKARQGLLPASSPAFKGLWILGSGNDKTVRGLLLARRSAMWSPWASVLVPWACPDFVDKTLAEGYEPKPVGDDIERVANVRAVLRLAALVDAAPEAYDLCLQAWMDPLPMRAQLTLSFPHLAHVVAKSERFADSLEPPEVLCRTFVRLATDCARANRGATKYYTEDNVQAAAERPPPSLATVAYRLEQEGCFDAAERIKSRNEVFSAVFAFDARGPVSWIDLVFSQKFVWPQTYGLKKDRPVLVRDRFRAFVVLLKTAGPPVVYSHPLTALTTHTNTEHVLWSRRTELLAACV